MDKELLTMALRFWQSLSGLDKWIIGTVGPTVAGAAGRFFVLVYKFLTNHAPHMQDSLKNMEQKQDETNKILAEQSGYLRAIAGLPPKEH